MSNNTLDMLLVHRVFRREFHDVSGLIEGVAAGDVSRARIVGEHLSFMLAALHHHHAAEDELVWPKLHSRVPGREEQLARMVVQHNEIATRVARVESLLATWVKSADVEMSRQLLAAVSDLSAQVDEHLADEERDALPIIEKYLTREEWAAAIKRGASFLSARNLRLGIVLGGMVLDGATPDERRVLMPGVPLPQRLIVQLFGARATAAYKRRLEGAAS